MTKLSGTSGQLFAGLAESITRGAPRSGHAAGGKSVDDSSFNDLLHNVSNLAKRALADQDSEPNVKAGGLHTHLAHLTEHDKPSDQVALDGEEDAGQPASSVKSSSKSPGKVAGKSPDKQVSVDHAAKPEVESRATLPAVTGQELVVAPEMKPQARPQPDARKELTARDPQPSISRHEVQTASTAVNVSAAAVVASIVAPSVAASTVIAPSGPRPQAPAVRVMAAASPGRAPSPGVAPEQSRSAVQRDEPATIRPVMAGGMTQQGSAASGDATALNDAAPGRQMPGASGFEAVAANVEHAAKASVRETLPEATKVTVLQQETHLPPVPQFNASQQVANAVVAELKEAATPQPGAASDPAAPQGNVPDQPLKILTINLEPAALGNVTVRLRLVGSEVSVHLAAERKDTSQMLDQQRDSIRELMQSAGYVADVAPVQHGSLDGFQSGSGQSQPQHSGQHQPSAQSQGAFGGSSNSSAQSEGGTRQGRQERHHNQETRHDQDVGPNIRRGPVYL